MSKQRFDVISSSSWPEGYDSLGARIRTRKYGDAGQARSLDELGGQTQILTLLQEIGKELTSILDLDELLRTVGKRVKELVDYDIFNVMLLNDLTQRLEHAFSLQYDQRITLKRTLALGEGLCGTAALERVPIRVNKVSSDPRYVRCEATMYVESELVVPLIAQDRLLGVLDLESLRPNAFSEDHEQMLTTLASTVAIALENARLYDQLRRAEQRRKEDLERAREVQQLLLPSVPPAVPGLDIATHYLPAQELGGDFYDFLPYADGRLAIAVGDVAGKGSAAALLAALGVGILREHAVHSPAPPAEMLADLNGHLQIPGGKGRFIALSLGVYDPATHELTIANAGFPRPLLVRDGNASSVDVTGVPLGILPNSTYESARLRLKPGDIVVFCSDGIHEQTNGFEEEYGIERLLSHLSGASECASAEQIAANIAHSIDEYSRDGASRRRNVDDRTIVILRVTDPIPSSWHGL